MPSYEYALLIFMDILLLQKIVKINMQKISFSIVKNADINLKQWIYFLSIILMLAKLEPEKKMLNYKTSIMPITVNIANQSWIFVV